MNAPAGRAEHSSHDQKQVSPQTNVPFVGGLTGVYTHAMCAQNVGQIVMKLTNAKKVT